MPLTQIDTFLIRILHICAAMIVLLQVLGLDSAVSLLFSMTFVFVAALWIAAAVRKVTSLDILILCVIVLALLNVSLNTWINNTAISFGYLRKFIIFSFTLLYFGAVHKLAIDNTTQKLLFGLNSGLTVFLIVQFFLNPTKVYIFNGLYTDYLTFGFTNPNLLAMFLLCIFYTELLQIFRPKKIPAKIFHLALASVLFYFIIETGSRNCLLVAITAAAVLGVLFLRKKAFRIPLWLAVIIAVFPFLFAAAYLSIVDTPVFQNLFSFLVSDGKGLDSRVTMWQTSFAQYWASPLLGSYSQIVQNDTSLQMHNTHIDILVSYGPMVLLLVCCVLYQLIHQSGRDKFGIAASVCFAFTVIMGMAEAAIFSGGLGIYLFAGVFLLLRRTAPADPSKIESEV